jgi:Uma2 family endonuclease
MVSTVAPPVRPACPQVQYLALHDVSWGLYEHLLEEVGDRPIRITYDNGSMEIMSPLPEHERGKKIIGGLIELIALELNIPMCRLGSTTFKRKDLGKGLEPDECYYLRHEAQVRGKNRLDLPQDPPPDLVVEIDISYRAVDRERIYAALGVPEVWRYDGLRLTGLHLGPDGRYQAIEKSVAFPFLRIADLAPFLKMTAETDETSVMRAFRDWVRANLLA